MITWSQPSIAASAIEVGGDPALPASSRLVYCGHCLGHSQPLGIDVVERDVGVFELLEREDVAEQVLGELDAARADECDLGHER